MKIQGTDIPAVSGGMIWPMSRDTLWGEGQGASTPHSTILIHLFRLWYQNTTPKLFSLAYLSEDTKS